VSISSPAPRFLDEAAHGLALPVEDIGVDAAVLDQEQRQLDARQGSGEVQWCVAAMVNAIDDLLGVDMLEQALEGVHLAVGDGDVDGVPALAVHHVAASTYFELACTRIISLALSDLGS
jgi:hypothetical protein